jgi:hypothetical protein
MLRCPAKVTAPPALELQSRANVSGHWCFFAQQKVWHMRGKSGQASNRAKLLRFAGAGQAPANSALGGLNLAGRTQACALKPHDCGDAQRMALARSPWTLPCNSHRASHWIDRSRFSVGRGIIIQDEITTARKWRSGDKLKSRSPRTGIVTIVFSPVLKDKGES